MTENPFDKKLLHPRYWLIWLGYGLLRLLMLLPYTWIQKLGLGLGYAISQRVKRRRDIVKINAELCFPEFTPQQQQKFIDDVIANTVFGFFESAYSWFCSDKFVATHSRLEGIEHIQKAQENGQGIILIGAHFTCQDFSGRVMSLRTETNVTFRKQDNLLFDWIVNHGRKDHYKERIEKREMRRMLRTLKNGQLVWYATDQDFGRQNSTFAPFFGTPAATITTVASLIRLTGAKPLFYSCFREGSGKDTMYVGHISDPFKDQFSKDEVANATLLNTVLEDCLRYKPEQYLWAHRRFKTRPDPKEPNPYPKKKRKKK